MNGLSFYIKVQVLKLDVSCKFFLEVQMNSCLFNIVSSILMKTQPIIITMIIKSAINNFGMESSCANFISKLVCANSKRKSVNLL